VNSYGDTPCDATAPGDPDRKLRSLLQLGHLIGLDLQLDEMLLQIAKKATEVMEADRFSIFLHDVARDELFTTVALGMGTREIRVPANSGIAGHCLRTGEIIHLDNAYADPRLNREVEVRTGYRTKTLLSMPFYSRDARPLGVAQALNKKKGAFTEEDKVLLRMFINQAAVFIEMGQLQKARIDALEQSRRELERLDRIKTKVIHHVSHELKTPIAVIQGNVRLLKQRLRSVQDADWQTFMDSLERHVRRLSEIQKETRDIFRMSLEAEAASFVEKMVHIEEEAPAYCEMTEEMRQHWQAVKNWAGVHLVAGDKRFRPIRLRPLVERILRIAAARAPHRKIDLAIRGDYTLKLSMNLRALTEVLDGLVRNAFENTPDGSNIEILFGCEEGKIYIHVQDYGIGITDENKVSLFDGFLPARETELYSSKRPYEFGAGGKGLDLLRAKLYAERFGFSISAESSRCRSIPVDQELCPGDVSLCGSCRTADDCRLSGGSMFTLTFPPGSEFSEPASALR